MKPKAIYYREDKHFDESGFFEEFTNTNFNAESGDPNEIHEFSMNEFFRLVIKHTLCEGKHLGG